MSKDIEVTLHEYNDKIYIEAGSLIKSLTNVGNCKIALDVISNVLNNYQLNKDGLNDLMTLEMRKVNE